MDDKTNFKLVTQFIDYNRIFLLSDLHFGVRSNSFEWVQNQLLFFKEFYIPYLKENIKENDCLFILGDFFDNRQNLDIYVMNTAISIVIDLANIIPIYFLVGNHDIYKKHDTDVNSLATFKFIKNVTIFEKPIVISNNLSKILIVPWIGDKNIEQKLIEHNKCEYVFMHTDISSFDYDNGRKIKKGVQIKKTYEIKKLFSGHIHKRQEKKNTIYIGSPYHTKRGDIGNKKGVYIFEPNNNKYSFTKNEYTPIFQRLRLENLLELTLKEVYTLLQNNYTDIIVPDKYIHIFNLPKFINLLRDCSYKKIEAISDNIKIDDTFYNIIDDENITDIISLLEQQISDTDKDNQTKKILLNLNQKYYELATKDE